MIRTTIARRTLTALVLALLVAVGAANHAGAERVPEGGDTWQRGCKALQDQYLALEREYKTADAKRRTQIRALQQNINQSWKDLKCEAVWGVIALEVPTGPTLPVDHPVLNGDLPDLERDEPNAAPGAAADAYRAQEDRPLRRDAARGVLANDADPDRDPLTARLVEGPAKGKLTLNPDGSFAYTPKRNFHGTDRFTYEVSDGKGGTATATVTIKVAARPN